MRKQSASPSEAPNSPIPVFNTLGPIQRAVFGYVLNRRNRRRAFGEHVKISRRFPHTAPHCRAMTEHPYICKIHAHRWVNYHRFKVALLRQSGGYHSMLVPTTCGCGSANETMSAHCHLLRADSSPVTYSVSSLWAGFAQRLQYVMRISGFLGYLDQAGTSRHHAHRLIARSNACWKSGGKRKRAALQADIGGSGLAPGATKAIP